MSDFWFNEIRELDMGDIDTSSTGMDQFLSDEEVDKTPLDERIASAESRDKTARVKVSSPEELEGFHRIADSDELVRMSEMDLWALEEDEDGEYVIERLFDENGEPLKV